MFMKLRFLLILSIITISFSLSPVLALKETTVYLPAVEDTKYGYEGVLATLIVDVKKGDGHVYVDTWPLTKIDTQASARMAKQVACELIQKDCSDYDFYYTIRSDARIVGGPSGGAAMTMATLASLLDLKVDKGVAMTGTINMDGSVGPVSGILEKAEAVSEKGNTFLIPYGLSTIEKKETTTEKIGWVTIEKQKPKKINVKDYAKKHWNLTVIEVKTIGEALEYFTNYKLKESEIKFERTEKYQEVMKKLAENLINRSSRLKKSCENKLEKATIGYDYQQQISKICGKSLDKVRQKYQQGNYYSAASIAFSNAISYRYGNELIDFLNNNEKKYYLRDYLRELESKIFEINTTNIELYAIIEERLSEAKNKLDDAWKNYYNENYIEGLDHAAFAEERLYTAQLWMKYADEFPSYIENESEYLKEISNNMISEASSIITYTSITSSNSYIEKSNELLKKARDNYKEGNYYATIIYSLKSQANAELASELLFRDKDYLVELHRKKALVEIEKTSSIIGQSYYEYAQTLEEDNKDMALVYYTYAKKLSTLSEILNKEPNRQKIIPEDHIERISCDYEKMYLVMAMVGATLLAIGFILGRKLKA